MKIPFRIGDKVTDGKKVYSIFDFGYSKDEIDDPDGCWVMDDSVPINKKKTVFRSFEQLKKVVKNDDVQKA